MSHYFNRADPRIDYGRDDGPQDDPEGYLRYEAARAADLFCRAGGHPEAAPAIERTLLTIAELPLLPERSDEQQDLFAAQPH